MPVRSYMMEACESVQVKPAPVLEEVWRPIPFVAMVSKELIFAAFSHFGVKCPGLNVHIEARARISFLKHVRAKLDLSNRESYNTIAQEIHGHVTHFGNQ